MQSENTSSATNPAFSNLYEASAAIVREADTGRKCALAIRTAEAWFNGKLSLGGRSISMGMPSRPGRPDQPVLLPPRDMPKRSTGASGKLALIHSLAHIELNAVDLTWDMIGRFNGTPMPRSFYDDFVQVGWEEARHFLMIENRLNELGSHYGAMPAHDGLWEAAQSTEGSLIARLAIIPLVLEARGLDITPPLLEKMQQAGDHETANCLSVIYEDEKKHVAFGAKWFRFMCDRARLRPEPLFHDLVKKHFRGGLKPPFNDRARSEAGLTPGFYKPLVILTNRA
ncbi:ferritin-like domain-containing protein [Coralliovum pocilloporae]|uniref:ferritin-like domain-containing protein n=1 Tax=Coralliovum pocilloporae TaxID=3066369 RepID=UPI003306B0AC